MKNFIYFLIFCCILGCNEQNRNTDDGTEKLYVVVTTGMIADATKNIGKDLIIVDALMGPGVDPHLYKATANDTKKLAKANMIVYNGLHLEGKIGEILTKMGRQKPVYAVSEDIDHSLLHEPEELQGLYDPHIWFDVSLWKEAVKKITKALIEADSINAEHYKKNSEEYLKSLDGLHTWTKEQIASIPKEKRVLVTAHDAFGYFGTAYDIEVMGLQGISTVTESGIQDIERVIKVIVDRKISAIFVESSINKKGIKSVIEHCANSGHTVNIGGVLFSDAMGEEGTPEATYIGMVKHNVTTIVKALRTE